MAIKGSGGVIKRGSNAIAEVIDWSLDSSPTEEDISIINNGGVARTEAGLDTQTLTLNCFLSKTDLEQGALRSGTTGHTVTVFPAGDSTGEPTRVCANCAVTAYNESGGATGHVRLALTLKINGGITYDTAA